MLFPRNLYMVPGNGQVGPHGVKYDLISVVDEAELKLFVGKGWHETLPAALAAGAQKESLKKLQEMDEALPPPSVLKLVPPAPPAPPAPDALSGLPKGLKVKA